MTPVCFFMCDFR